MLRSAEAPPLKRTAIERSRGDVYEEELVGLSTHVAVEKLASETPLRDVCYLLVFSR